MSDIEKDKKGKNIPKSNIFRQRFQSTDLCKIPFFSQQMVKKIHTCINKMEFLILKAMYFMKKDNHYYEVAEESSNPFKDNT